MRANESVALVDVKCRHCSNSLLTNLWLRLLPPSLAWNELSLEGCILKPRRSTDLPARTSGRCRWRGIQRQCRFSVLRRYLDTGFNFRVGRQAGFVINYIFKLAAGRRVVLRGICKGVSGVEPISGVDGGPEFDPGKVQFLGVEPSYGFSLSTWTTLGAVLEFFCISTVRGVITLRMRYGPSYWDIHFCCFHSAFRRLRYHTHCPGWKYFGRTLTS